MMTGINACLEYLEDRIRILSVQSPSKVVWLAATVYLIFTLLALSLHDWNPLWFIWIGERYASLDPNGNIGYDGQFVFYIAHMGESSIPHLDNPGYRLQRILWPIVLRLLSSGSPALIPWLAILLNFVAIMVTTRVLAIWLDKQNLSPWYALMYALYIGTFMAYSRALTEPLAYCLATIGAVQWLERRQLWAVIAMAMATLTKETTVLFIAGAVVAALIQKDLKSALAASLAALPLTAWQLGLLAVFATMPLTAGPVLEMFPLYGIVPHLTVEPGRLSAFLFVGLPSLLFLPVSLVLVHRQRGRLPTGWWLLLHCILVVLMPINVYDHIMHAGRNGVGLVLSVLFLTPSIFKPVRLLILGYWILPTLVWAVPVLRWAPWIDQAHLFQQELKDLL